MSGKPQETREDAIQDDILEQVFTDGLNKVGRSAPEAPAEEAPMEEASPGEEKKPSEDKRNKRTSVYIYLVILFGAAFMMLLLAYFIQQRNSETAISDLRSSMNMSRAELMDEIETLETENEALRMENELQKNKAGQAQKDYREQKQINEELEQRRFEENRCTSALGYLERFCREQDYLMAAVVVEYFDLYFNEKNSFYINSLYAENEPLTLPIQRIRYLELREEVIDNSGCMILSEYFTGSDMAEDARIMEPNGRYENQTITAARHLWEIIDTYSYQEFGIAAILVSEFYTNTDYDDLEQLNSGQFQPSTVALFEQIVAELTQQGRLELDEDGNVIGYISLYDDPVTIEIGTADVDVSRETSE